MQTLEGSEWTFIVTLPPLCRISKGVCMKYVSQAIGNKGTTVCCRENLGPGVQVAESFVDISLLFETQPHLKNQLWGVEDLKSYFPCFLAPSKIRHTVPKFTCISPHKTCYSTFRTCPPGLSGSPYSPPNSVHTASSTQLRSIALTSSGGPIPLPSRLAWCLLLIQTSLG